MKEENRDIVLHLRVSQSEYERIQRKMADLGVHSMSAYLRKMAMDGYCLRLDYDEMKQMVHLLRVTSNNLNQYAKRANENGSIYAVDIQDLQQRLDNLWSVCKDILAKLATIR